jgi:hypothetical protein
MAKLNGTNPIGTKHSIRAYENGNWNWTDYQVTLVSGVKKHVPSAESVVYVETVGRPDGAPPEFLAIPLERFVARAAPAQDPAIKPQSKADVFWE